MQPVYGMAQRLIGRARLLAREARRPEPGMARRPPPPDPVGMVARQRLAPQPVVATQKLEKTSQPAGKARQRWKYKGYNIERAATVMLNGRYYTDPKEDPVDPCNASDKHLQGTRVADPPSTAVPRRLQESNFFITINPNRQYPEQIEGAAKAQFIQALQHMQSNEVIARLIKFGPKSDHYINDVAHDVILPGINWKASVEIGEKKNRMHAHIIVYVKHYSQIQFDAKMLQHEFKQAFNANLPDGHLLTMRVNPYVQVKMLPQTQWKEIMRQYLFKGMDGIPEQPERC
jgi:hypothetical protein